MNSPFELVIPFITRSIVSGLLIVVCNVELLPNTTFPKFRLEGLMLKTCPNKNALYSRIDERIVNSLSITHPFNSLDYLSKNGL
ncbi:MAG: hypothetical protein JETCAE03_31720 [Ignavibacteriaceae bacterium]|nr:MAG: hypothetical protein JETCAE03_31720 [Ignavibacteriaceae bacterium]